MPLGPGALGAGCIPYGESMPIPLPLSTERLTLRTYLPGDIQALLAYYSDPEVARYLLDDPWTQEYAEQQMPRQLTRTGLDSEARSLAVVVEHEGAVIGDLAIWLNDDTGQKAEIGWVFSPQAAGKGFAAEAAAALIDAAFTHHDLHRIEAQMDARNDASARLCERLGMQREAHLRENWWMKGEWTSTLVYGVLASER